MNFTDSFKKKIVVIIFTAVAFSLLWPFLSFEVAGLTINLADGFPVMLGFMFGSSGAIGCFLGAIGPDIFSGELSLGTLASALGYFALAYAPYKIWAVILKREEENVFLIKKLGDVAAYLITGAIGSLLCALPPAFIDDVYYQSEALATGYIFEVIEIAIAVFTVGLVMYAVLSAFDMFGLAKSVKKYPLKTHLHMLTLTIDAIIILIIAVVGHFFAGDATRNLWIVVPVAVFGVFMFIDLMYGGSKPEIIEKQEE